MRSKRKISQKDQDQIGYLEHEVEFENCTTVTLYQRISVNLKARLAIEMIERWGSVSATTDGEDSAGRSRLRLMTPKELVTRAIETAECAYSEFRKRKWLQDIPSPKIIGKKKDEDD